MFQGASALATFRFTSGLPYTRTDIVGRAAGPQNGSTMPWIRNVDLRLLRGFRMSHGRTITAFADIRNLFNFTNIVNLFTETGNIFNGRLEHDSLGAYMSSLQLEADTFATRRLIGGSYRTGIDLRYCADFNPNATRRPPRLLHAASRGGAVRRTPMIRAG